MSSRQATAFGDLEDFESVAPAALPDTTRQEQVNVGEQVADLLKHPGFQALAHALHLNGESILNNRVLRQPTWNAAAYADAMGHLRGLREVVQIAKGLVQNGKEAGQALREEEG